MNRFWARPITFTHLVVAAGVGFFGGVVTMSYFQWRMGNVTPQVTVVPSAPEPSLVATPPRVAAMPPPAVSPAPAAPHAMTDAESELRNRRLDLPVKGASRGDLRDSFNDARDGARAHEALDMLAPRNTPVLAVEDGKIVKLFFSKAGGITIYQFDPSSRFVYYYAHLEKYADGLAEGNTVQRGQVIGYVGTTGNAPKDTPHLHFAIFQLDEKKEWWKGTPLDPYPILK